MFTRAEAISEEGLKLPHDHRVAGSKCVAACCCVQSLWVAHFLFLSELVLLLTALIDFSWKVWAVNSAGKAPSSWTRCRTGPAPPEGLTAPRFHAVSSTQAVVNISAPGKPNGVISLYRLFSNSTGVAEVVVSSP